MYNLSTFRAFSLKTLNVSANRLTFVPPETLYNLSDVRELDLSHNELPGGISYRGLNVRLVKVYKGTKLRMKAM